MIDKENTDFNKQPVWLRIVSIVGVIWYLFGFSQLLKNLTMNVGDAVASGAISEAHGAALTATPTYIWAAYFIACLLGLLGAIQLLRNRLVAWKLFFLSVIFDVIYFGWFHVSGTASARPREAGIIAIVVITVGIIFTILSYRRASKQY